MIKIIDFAIVNGNIYTMDEKNPVAEAVVCKYGKIVKVGKNEEIKELISKETEVIDLNGKTLFPGFSDNHMHPLLYGFFATGVKLFDVTNMDEFIKRVKEKLDKAKPGEMILGMGWNQELMDEKRYPTIEDIDSISPNNPVFLIHYNFHVYFANSYLLKQKKLTKDTVAPAGGTIIKDENGNLTGVLEENAIDLIAPGFLESGAGLFSFEEAKEALKICIKDAIKNGIVTIGDAIADDTGIRAWQQLYKEGELPCRVNIWALFTKLDTLVDSGIESGMMLGDHMVRLAGIKLLGDGSLSSHTAALREDFTDAPGNKGTLRLSSEEMTKYVVKAHKNGLRLHIHALGDRANDIVLDAYEAALREKPDPDPRFQIAHCLVLSEDIIKRYKKLDIYPQIQPAFLFKGQRWAPKLLGKERLKYVHAWGQLVNAGLCCMAGTDAPIEGMKPVNNIYACVVRKDLEGNYYNGEKMVSSGESCYRPEEKISVHEAIMMLTVNSAYGTFEEDVKGSVEPGKFADFVVLSDDPYIIEPEKIKDIEVEMTIVGGKTVYKK